MRIDSIKINRRAIKLFTLAALLAAPLSAPNIVPARGADGSSTAVTEALARRHSAAASKPTATVHAKPATAAHANKDAAGAAEIWTDLMEGNRRFVMGQPLVRDLINVRQQLVNGQHPKVIVLTCSDSRVCPELLFDKTLGELFVIRTAGNVADRIALGSIEYAVEHLHSPALVILGHEKCGGVGAAASGVEMPTLNLDAIVQKIAPVINRLEGLATGDRLVSFGVEANVYQVAKDMLRSSPIVHEAVETGELTIIKAK